MPYTVTTKRPTHDSPFESRGLYSPGYVIREAVATLEEAQETARLEVSAVHRGQWSDEWETHARFADGLPESGGTVGPLPDGTVIEVERVTWNALADAIAGPQFVWPASTEAAQRAQLDAYNARHA